MKVYWHGRQNSIRTDLTTTAVHPHEKNWASSLGLDVVQGRYRDVVDDRGRHKREPCESASQQQGHAAGRDRLWNRSIHGLLRQYDVAFGCGPCL